MSIWFFISLIGVIAIIPLYFLSLEHQKLDKKYGKDKGKKVGAIYGYISGWTFFGFWFGIYFSPQPSFIIPIFPELAIGPLLDITFPIFHIILSSPFIILAFWFGLVGVKGTGLETAETHRAEKVIDSGIYSVVRHPQYLGGLMGHIGFTILLSRLYSLIFLPIMVLIVYIISWKEEKELCKEFGDDYKQYQEKVPMLIPRIKKNK
jgi:protein-S-isoprenylcysteine O-methyltransferase Ste14